MTTDDKKKEVQNLTLGAIAGAGATAAVMPIDNLIDESKSRKSALDALIKSKALAFKDNIAWTAEQERALTQATEHAPIKTILKDWKSTPASFYRGMPLKMLKIAPAVALQFYIYNKAKQMMDKKASALDNAAAEESALLIAKHRAHSREEELAIAQRIQQVRNNYYVQDAQTLGQISKTLRG